MNSKITEKINSDEILQEIINNFENEIYLVGGAVRDFLTGKSTNDRDLLILDEELNIVHMIKRGKLVR